MAWLVPIVSGAFEAVWAIALDRSQGFSRLWPSVVFFLALCISMDGLAYALRTLPVGSGYAIWVGVGAGIAVLFSFATGQEPVTLAKVLCLLMIVSGIVGLKVTA